MLFVICLIFEEYLVIQPLEIFAFLTSEIYLQRVKRFLSKKMKLQWNEVLNIDYLNSINCWATLADLQKVIPFHANRYKQIILNSTIPSSCIIIIMHYHHHHHHHNHVIYYLQLHLLLLFYFEW